MINLAVSISCASSISILSPALEPLASVPFNTMKPKLSGACVAFNTRLSDTRGDVPSSARNKESSSLSILLDSTSVLPKSSRPNTNPFSN